jgi:hypothetical protein
MRIRKQGEEAMDEKNLQFASMRGHYEREETKRPRAETRGTMIPSESATEPKSPCNSPAKLMRWWYREISGPLQEVGE